MERLEIHISYKCENNCIFCSEKNRLNRFKGFKIDIGEIKDLLKEKRLKGFKHVNFTGGEPTLYSDFLELLKYAKGLGYKIYIGSNGLFWSKKQNCEEYLSYIDEISLSLHGHDEQTHQSLTKNEQSFAKIKESFNNINNYIKKNEKAPGFFCNIVLTKINYTYLDRILEFVSQFDNLNQVLVSYVAPEGRAYEDYNNLAVPYNEIKLKINDWVDIAEKNNKIIRFFGIPLCILGDKKVFSNDLNWDDRVTYELGKKESKVFLKEKETKLDRRRQKIKICDKCDVVDLCGGIFTHYLNNFGEKEIGYE